MRKVIFVHLLNDFSGSPKVLSQVIDVVQKKGHQTVLYTGKGDEGFLTDITKVHRFYYYRRFNNRYKTLISFILSQISLFFRLLKYVNKDVVIYVNTMLPFGAGLAGFLMRKPVYYHVHEISLTPVALKKFLRSIIQLSAKKIIYVSDSVKSSEPFKNKISTVVHNALPSEFAKQSSMNQAQHTNKGQFNVLMIGSLKAYKGIFEFLEIAKRTSSNLSISFVLVLNAEKEEIKSFFQPCGVPSNVRLVHRQKNVIPFYENANLVLNLSRIDEWVETFGLTIIEALAFGIPVIVPPVGGPSEIVRNGVEGYLISSYDVNEIALKIEELCNNKKLWLKLSENARRRSYDFTEEKFSIKIMESINA